MPLQPSLTWQGKTSSMDSIDADQPEHNREDLELVVGAATGQTLDDSIQGKLQT